MIPDFKGHHFEKTSDSGESPRREDYRCARCGMTAKVRDNRADFFDGSGICTGVSLNAPLAASPIPACREEPEPT